jgi:hypothetical protein
LTAGKLTCLSNQVFHRRRFCCDGLVTGPRAEGSYSMSSAASRTALVISAEVITPARS